MSLLDEVAAHGLAFCKSNNDMLALKNVYT